MTNRHAFFLLLTFCRRNIGECLTKIQNHENQKTNLENTVGVIISFTIR